MSVTMQHKHSSLPPIFKHSSRKWKELSEEGKSVGINDPKLKVGYLGDLGRKTKIELEELISRQDKLLCNTNFVAKLQDGGQRLQGRRQELQRALDKLEESHRDHSALLPIPDMTALEWQWRSDSPSKCDHKEEADPLDSDDDEDPDPLHLLATHSMDAPPRLSGAPGSHIHKQMQDDIDPSEAIREELRKLNLRDQISGEKEQSMAPHNHGSKAKQLDSDLAQDFGSKMLISLEKKSEMASKREVFKPFRLKDKQKLLVQKPIEMDALSKGALGSVAPSIGKFDSTSAAQTAYQCPSHSNSPFTNTSTSTTGASVNPSFGVSAPPTFPSFQPINVTGPRARRSALWACESAATGPLTFGAGRTVQLIPLRESVELERLANERLKELQLERPVGGSFSSSGGSSAHKRGRLFAYRDENAKDMFLDDDNDDNNDFLANNVLSDEIIGHDDDSVEESSDGDEED